MPQRHPDKTSVVHYVINIGLDSILFAYETWGTTLAGQPAR
ncbi:MAG TPA: hypothetical protein VGR65_11910 [Casimicrobiaceae bacterium]|jgi:hypothetical protein|nr:hypothetical protein [Casimicrobiaceae bacterium]